MTSFRRAGSPRSRCHWAGESPQCQVPLESWRTKADAWILSQQQQVRSGATCTVGRWPDDIGSFSHSVSRDYPPPPPFSTVMHEGHNSPKSSDKGLAHGFSLFAILGSLWSLPAASVEKD